MTFVGVPFASLVRGLQRGKPRLIHSLATKAEQWDVIVLLCQGKVTKTKLRDDLWEIKWKVPDELPKVRRRTRARRI